MGQRASRDELGREPGGDLAQWRPRPVLALDQRRSNVNESGDALVRREPKRIEHAPIVGVPASDPVRPIAERMRGKDKVHGGGTGGQHLLPFRDFDVRGGATDYRDHQRGLRETVALEFDLFRFGLRIFGPECSGNRSAGGKPRVALEHDEAPRRQLAVVGYAARDRQKRVDFAGRWARRAQCGRLAGPARGKEFNGIGHNRFY